MKRTTPTGQQRTPDVAPQDAKVYERIETRRSIYADVLAKKPTNLKILIVGDRPGPSAPKDPKYHHTPFYSFKHCAGWLNKLLDASNIPENELAWINAYNKNGKPTDFSIVDAFNPYAVVALGGNAEKWLKKNKLEGYTKVDHPQYWKRFRSKERYPLVDVLIELTHKPT